MSLRSTIFIILSFSIAINCFSDELRDSDMSLGIKNYEENNYNDSIFYMNIVISKKSNLFSDALFWKAKSLYELQSYSDSKIELERFFRKASIETSYYEDARFLYCKLFFKLKRYDDALLLFHQFIRYKKFEYYSDSALFWLGETYLQLSELKLAKDAFEKYLDINPDSFVTQERINDIQNILTILDKKTETKTTLLDKANWLSEYVHNEQKEDSSSDEMYISNFLNNFNNKDDFFKWLQNNSLVDNVNNDIISNSSVDLDADEVLSIEEIDTDEVLSIEETDTDEVISIEETDTDEVLSIEETDTDEVISIEETDTDEVLSIEETDTDEVLSIEETDTDEVLSIEETVTDEIVSIEETDTDESIISDDNNVEENISNDIKDTYDIVIKNGKDTYEINSNNENKADEIETKDKEIVDLDSIEQILLDALEYKLRKELGDSN